MRWIKNLGLGLVLIALIDSCIKQPEYSVVPEIKSLDISFKRPTDPRDNDSLIFTITFRDGDGDLGINSDEITVNSTDVRSPWFYIYDTVRGQIAGYADRDTINMKKYNSTNNTTYAYVNYRAIREKLVQSADTFPTVNCANWQLSDTGNGDTLYITVNFKAYNFIVNAYLKDASGTYTAYFTPGSVIPFSSSSSSCAPPAQGIDGAFPVLSSDLGKSAPMDGTITYYSQSADVKFYPLVSKKTIRFDIYITDRAFHKSNVVSTEYTFQ